MNEQNTLLAQMVPFLLARDYRSDERAPSERELAVRFQASRSQIREALSVLEALRLVARRPKSGIYMTPELASIEALTLFTQIGVPLTESELAQLMEVRRVQEIEAVRLACARRTDEDLATMQDALGQTAAAISEGRPVTEPDRAFHGAVGQATHNLVLLRLLNIFHLMSEQRRAVYFEDPERCREAFNANRRLYKAIAARDEAKAATLSARHLDTVETYWRGVLHEPGPAPSAVGVGQSGQTRM